MSHLTAVVYANAKTNGISDEQLQVNLLKEKSSAVSGVVNRALTDNDYALAKGLFEANKTNLLPAERDRLQKSINVGNNRARSQAKTDQIMSLNLTKEEALKKAREIKNPEIRDDTVARVKARYGEIEQVTLAKDKQTSSNVAAQIEGGQEVNIPMLTGLDDSSRTALTNYQTKLRSGEAIETNPATKADLDFMVTDNPNAFLNTNLYAYRDKLSNKDFNDLLTKQTNAIEGTKTKKDFSPKSLFSDTAMVKNAAGEFGIIDNTKTAAKQSGEAKRRYYDFQQMTNEELMSEQEKKGEALTDAEKQTAINKVAARFAIDVKEKGWIYDSDKKLGDLTTEQLQSGDYYLSDEKERNRLKILLTNQGIEPTEQNIIYAKSRGL
ncbi:hypothetical protein [Vibrio harveyi]|uniref:hypothetical protein n=1 Tax=Vibrio harveyi TaxID=669 RepID=UPI00217CE185|nr:hypothetical protein [Vibrio harveyi]